MSKTKTLTAYLFEALENVSKATESDIDVVVKKAKATIEISQQALNVAQMKLEVISTTGELTSTFEEICDAPFELAPANDQNNQQDNTETSANGEAQTDQDNLKTYGNRTVSQRTLGNRKELNRGY